MDVLVVGAGPVGLMMAAELARHDVRVRVIDKSASPSPLSKALAIHARTLEVFEQLGIVGTFLQRGLRVEGLTAWMGDTGRAAHVDFKDLDSSYPFVLDIPQTITEEILAEHLSGFGIEIERGTELLSLHPLNDGMQVQLRDAAGTESSLQVAWVIGCDGAHSTVRHQLNIAFEGTQYPDTFLLGDVHVDWSLPEDRIHVFLREDGLLAAFPYGQHRYRVMANLPATTGQEAMPEATMDELQKLVQARSPVDVRISDPTWVSWFHSHLRHVKQTRIGRVFLVGDAAHIHSPAGGQGMNTGIQDAHNLGWKLALVVRGGAPEKLLDSYQEERLAVAESVLKMSDSLLRTVTSNRPMVKLLRDHLAPVFMNTAFAQYRMTEQISEVAIHYRDSSIVHSHWTHKRIFSGNRLHAGDRLPDVEFVGDAGVVHRLYDLVRGTRHAVFVFTSGEAGWQPLMEQLAAWRNELTVFCVRTKPSRVSVADVTVVEDATNAIAGRLGLPDESVLVVRPDGYVGFLSDTLDAPELNVYMQQFFQAPGAGGGGNF